MKKILLLIPACVLPLTLILWSPEREARANDHKSFIEQLEAGNRRFVKGLPRHDHQNRDRRSEVAKAQKPFAIVVGCADSRVPPELVFDQGLGDLFVVRCAGNLLGDAALGSIEYAVEHLDCRLIVVLGHERCGAVDAVLKGGPLPGHLAAFVPDIEPLVAEAKRLGGDVLDNAVGLNAKRIADELRKSKPILEEFSHSGQLTVIAGRYDLDSGEVEWIEDPLRQAAPSHSSLIPDAAESDHGEQH